MATTDSRTGFRLPWGQDRAHETQPAEPAEAATQDAGEAPAAPVAWPDSDFNARLGIAPQQQREPDPIPEGTETPEPETPSATLPSIGEPAMTDPVPQPAPAAATAPAKRPTKLLADLAAAIRATTEAAREAAVAQVDEEAAEVIARIRAGSADGEAALKAQSDEDISGIKDWSKAEIARIKEEAEARITARKATLNDELAAHAAALEGRVREVDAVVGVYHADMDAYAGRLAAEEDPARLATMAETMPEAPSLGAWSSLENLDLTAVADAPVEVVAAAEPEPVVEAVVEVAPEPESVAEAVVEVAPEPESVAEAVVDTEPVVEAEAEAVVEPVAEAEPVTEPAVASPWGDPNPWLARDAAPAAEETLPASDVQDDIPRWAAGETPDGFPDAVEGGDPVDRGAIMAALEAAAEAVVAAEAAAESADQAEAAADVAETAAELLKGRASADDDYDPEAIDAFSARLGAGGLETESFQDRLASLLPGHDGAEGTGPGTTQVVVTGLVSVASIASFKRHLARIAGVAAVAVASGPEGEFVFNVNHGADVAFRDAIPTLPGFAARVTSVADGVVSVTARDPETEG